MQLLGNRTSAGGLLPGADPQMLVALMHARAEVARLRERDHLFSTLDRKSVV